MRIALVRHAHAEKNVGALLGGAGSSLSALGRAQAAELAERVADELPLNGVLCVDRPQCLETARLVAHDPDSVEVVTLPPYRLGAVEGLSWAEAHATHPEVMLRFEAWNRGEIDIAELDLPGAQDPAEYYEAGELFLARLAEHRDDVLLVATRSALVLLWNVLQGNDPRRTRDYKHVEWANAELRVATWERP